MDVSVLLFLGILVAAFTLFVKEVFPLEISALIVLIALVATGILNSREAFSSFGNDSIILIGSLFVIVGALQRTGLINQLERYILRLSGDNRTLSFAIILLLVAFFSAFVSNTATLAISIPIVVSIAKKFGDSPRAWLLPMGFASLLGGMNTLIGTSTNIIISGLLPDYGLDEFGLFTTSHIGFPIFLVGLLYLLLASRYLLSGDSDGDLESIGVKYDLRSYSAEVRIEQGSSLCDVTISESPLFREIDITVLGVLRGDLPVLVPRGSLHIREGDRLIVEGNINKLTEILGKYGLRFSDERVTSEENTDVENQQNGKRERSKSDSELSLHEVLVSAHSRLIGKTPKESYLRNRRRISLIAINRQGVTIRKDLSDVRIVSGDILVVQFLEPQDNHSLDNLGLVPLQELKHERFRSSLAPLAAIIFFLSLFIGSATSFPIALCCLAGAVAMVVCGVLRIDEVYQSIEWRVLIFIGAVLCLGKGMDASGTATAIAELLRLIFQNTDAIWALGFFFFLTLVMTQLLSNQATAVVMIPVAITTAEALGLNPMTFVMAVTIAASCAFMTPFEPALILVYGPGGYKFSDFLRLGFFLALFASFIAVLLIPQVWPFVV